MLCRVQWPLHSAKIRDLSSAWPVALGKPVMFAECNGHCTRQSLFPGSSQMVTLPSVMAIALGKVTKNSLFYLFFTSHPNKQKIYITNITNITYISSTTHIYHQHHIYITNVTYISQMSHVSQYITNKFTSNPSAPSSSTTIANRSIINNHKYHH